MVGPRDNAEGLQMGFWPGFQDKVMFYFIPGTNCNVFTLDIFSLFSIHITELKDYVPMCKQETYFIHSFLQHLLVFNLVD